MAKCFVLGESFRASPTAKILSSAGLPSLPYVMPNRQPGFYDVCKKETELEVVAVFCRDFEDNGRDIMRALRGVLGENIKIHALIETKEKPDKAFYNGIANEISHTFPLPPALAASFIKLGLDKSRLAKLKAEESREDEAEPHQLRAARMRKPTENARVGDTVNTSNLPSLLPPIQRISSEVVEPADVKLTPVSDPALPHITKAFKGVSLDLESLDKNPPLQAEPQKISIKGKHRVLMFLDPRRLQPLPYQPRSKNNRGFSKESLQKLGDSIRHAGQQKAAKVCRSLDPAYDAMIYGGGRRHLACMQAGLMLYVEINEKIDPHNEAMLHFLAVVDNFDQEGLSCIELAVGFKKMHEDNDISVNEIAESVGRTSASIYQHLSLLNLPQSVQELLETPAPKEKKYGRDNLLSVMMGHALSSKDFTSDDQVYLARLIVDKEMGEAQAKVLIETYRKEKGLPSRRLHTGPKRIFEGLVKLAERADSSFSRYIDLSADDFSKVMDVTTVERRGVLAAKCRQVGTKLISFADLVIGGRKTAPGDD